MSDRPEVPPSYHYVRRDLDPGDWRTLLAAAAGAAVGVGAVVLYLGRVALARDRVDAVPPRPPAGTRGRDALPRPAPPPAREADR